MGFLDFLKSHNSTTSQKPKPTVHYKKGYIYLVEPISFKSLSDRRNEIYQASIIEVDGKIIDLTSVEDINNISVKSIHHPSNNTLGVCGSLDYVLRMKAGDYYNAGQMELAIACLRKATSLMFISPIAWQKKDYLRLVRYLKDDRQFDEARKVETDLKEQHPELFDGGVILAKKRFQETLEKAKLFRTDLIEMSMHSPTCGECAKYQGRVYSISGRDKRYPALPDFFKEYGGVHAGCRHTFFAYIHGSPTSSGKNAPRYSNRAFTDNRSKAEKEEYAEILKERQQEIQKEAGIV